MMHTNGTATSGSCFDESALTKEKILEFAARIAAMNRIPAQPTIKASKFCEDALPRMTLAENVDVTPEFRASVNACMLEFFGTKDAAYQIKDPLTGREMIITSQRMIDKIMIGEVESGAALLIGRDEK